MSHITLVVHINNLIRPGLVVIFFFFVPYQTKGVRASKHLSEQEQWEARQLINSGVLPVSEYPTFDPDSGMGILANFEETQEELEIELNEDEVFTTCSVYGGRGFSFGSNAHTIIPSYLR